MEGAGRIWAASWEKSAAWKRSPGGIPRLSRFGMLDEETVSGFPCAGVGLSSGTATSGGADTNRSGMGSSATAGTWADEDFPSWSPSNSWSQSGNGPVKPECWPGSITQATGLESPAARSGEASSRGAKRGSSTSLNRSTGEAGVSLMTVFSQSWFWISAAMGTTGLDSEEVKSCKPGRS